MMSTLRVLLAGGGTGGHVYPAIAIAEAMRSMRPSAEFLFVGTREKIEWDAVPRAGFNIKPITVSAFHRTKMWRNVVFPFKLASGLWESRKIVRDFKPDVAVGTGGYVSGPVIWAASKAKIPVVLQEQNAFPGKTTKMLSNRATQIHTAFPEASKHLPQDKCLLSGNPTRKSIADGSTEEALRHFGISSSRPVLLVFGGSLGSAKLNQTMEKKYNKLLEIGWTILWQTGKLYCDAIAKRIPAPPDNLIIRQFIHRMDLAYALADVALCRSGAGTCAELAVTGTAAVLVPSPNVAEDHQTFNARSLVSQGAAILIEEKDVDEKVVPTLSDLLGDSETRNQLADAARSIAKPDAANTIATAVLNLVDERGGEHA